MPASHRRTGFTLLEVVAALLLCGLVTLGGVMLLDQLNDGDLRIVREAIVNASSGNGDRVLRRLLADAEPAVEDSLDRFRGEERYLALLTRCDVPAGWAERCRAALSIDSLRDSSVLFIETDRGDRLGLRRLGGLMSFRYLDPVVRDSAWRRTWAASVTLPAAVALVSARDTIVLPVGSARD